MSLHPAVTELEQALERKRVAVLELAGTWRVFNEKICDVSRSGNALPSDLLELLILANESTQAITGALKAADETSVTILKLLVDITGVGRQD